MDAFKSRFDRLLKDYFVTVLSMGSTSGMPELMSLYHYVKMFRGMAISKHIVLTHGVASLAEELAKHVPVLYESPVRKIVMEKGRAVGVQMEGNGSIKKAAHVIVAVTPSVMADIMPDELDEERGFFQSLPYVQFPMPVFFLDRPINKDIWCYFNDPGLKRTFVFAIDQHSKIPEMIPSGKSILTGWAVYPETLRLVNMPDEEIIKIASKDIELMIPGFSKWIEEVKIFRHSYVNGLYPPGEYRKILDFSKKAKKLDGVSFVSAELHGTAIEGELCSAADEVERIIIGGKK